MLTNILSGSPEDVAAVSENPARMADLPRLELNGLDNSKLAALLAALGAPIEAKALEGEHYLVPSSAKGGPWLFQLPHQLRDMLAALQPQQIAGVAERWVSHEELTYDGWSATDVQPLIEMLHQFATNAVSAQKHLLLWMSL